MCIIVFVMLFDVYKVEGNSMLPVLEDGDYVIAYCFSRPKDNQIIICDAKCFYLDSNYVIKKYEEELSMQGFYLLGINESVSIDSRQLGEFPKYSFEGVAFMRLAHGTIGYIGAGVIQ